MKALLFGAIFFLMGLNAFAERASVVIDGLFDDWAGIPPAYSDDEGESSPGGVDFLNLWMADDNDFLFFRIESVEEFDSSENNRIILYIDTDDNPATGLSVEGIGAEVEWRLGDRRGVRRIDGQPDQPINFTALRFRGAPTVDSREFEFAVGRTEIKVNSGSTVNILWVDQTGGDRLPDDGQTLSYTFDQGNALPPLDLLPIERQRLSDIRIATYNVLNDSLFSGGAQPSFRRQIQAVKPDILSFQEIRRNSVSAAVNLMEQWIPLPLGESWHGAGRFVSNNDTIIVSRFPILETWQLFGSNTTTGNLAALIDTESTVGRKLLFIDAHLPAGSDEIRRQQEVDQIMAFIRNAKEEGGALTLDPDTPIIITGDLNLVGRSQQLQTLLDGDIQNEGRFGLDESPDWDGSNLTDLISRHTDAPMGYTWRNDNEGLGFWPGHLDFIIFSDSVLETGNNFIVYTPDMSPQRLAGYGLQSGDSLSSDHMMLVGDFRIPSVDELGGADVPSAPGWRRSPWYGHYYAETYPWVYHQEHGWQWVNPGSSEASVFLFDQGIGQWVFTNETVYRFMFVFGPPGEETWIWVFPENTPELRNFFNFRIGQLFSIPPQG